ncbi:DMT family transporter, partial [Phyllobacterium sp. SL163]|uniref:DMT family transporter n=1 Tax=unclassified Phyllobacterium TaxID=2638441 RepID=UPI003CF0EC17
MSAAGYRLGLVFVTGSAVAWSTAGFFTRLIQLDSWTMLAWRGIFGAIAIALVIFALEGRKSWLAFRTMGLPGWMFAAVSAIGMIFFITSLRHTTVAHGAVIYATVPFVAAGLSWLVLNEQPTRSAIIASLFALAGVALMMGLGVEGGLLGDVLAFGMTVCMAIMMVIARRYRNIPIMPAACLSALLSGLVCWPLGDPLAITS